MLAAAISLSRRAALRSLGSPRFPPSLRLLLSYPLPTLHEIGCRTIVRSGADRKRTSSKGQEPVLVQARGPKPTIERLDVCIVGRLPWPREVRDDAALASPRVHVTRDELTALIYPDRFRIADLPAYTVEGRHHIFAAVAVTCVKDGDMARERVDDRQHPQFPARRQLVMDEVHCPDLVRADRLDTIIT